MNAVDCVVAEPMDGAWLCFEKAVDFLHVFSEEGLSSCHNGTRSDVTTDACSKWRSCVLMIVPQLVDNGVHEDFIHGVCARALSLRVPSHIMDGYV